MSKNLSLTASAAALAASLPLTVSAVPDPTWRAVLMILTTTLTFACGVYIQIHQTPAPREDKQDDQ